MTTLMQGTLQYSSLMLGLFLTFRPLFSLMPLLGERAHTFQDSLHKLFEDQCYTKNTKYFKALKKLLANYYTTIRGVSGVSDTETVLVLKYSSVSRTAPPANDAAAAEAAATGAAAALAPAPAAAANPAAAAASSPAPCCSCCCCCYFVPWGGCCIACCCCCQAWWQAQSLRNKWLCLSSIVFCAKQQASRPAGQIENQKSVLA